MNFILYFIFWFCGRAIYGHFDYYLDITSGLWYIPPAEKGIEDKVVNFVAGLFVAGNWQLIKILIYKSHLNVVFRTDGKTERQTFQGHKSRN